MDYRSGYSVHAFSIIVSYSLVIENENCSRDALNYEFIVGILFFLMSLMDAFLNRLFDKSTRDLI